MRIGARRLTWDRSTTSPYTASRHKSWNHWTSATAAERLSLESPVAQPSVADTQLARLQEVVNMRQAERDEREARRSAPPAQVIDKQSRPDQTPQIFHHRTSQEYDLLPFWNEDHLSFDVKGLIFILSKEQVK